MQALKLVPDIFYFDSFKDFNDEFKLGKGDILVTNQWMYDPYVKPLGIDIPVIFQEKYGAGEPTDKMMDAMRKDMSVYDYDRIIAFGGGTIVDICKILALKPVEKVEDLYMKVVEPVKDKTLVVVPTTCGTGSEVTNVAVASLVDKGIKLGIAVEETYADVAVLIPESLEGLPDYVFSTSSIDALIHASECYLSPKATVFSDTYALKAIEMLIDGYKKIVANGGNNKENRKPYLKQFCLAADIAGIAFSNAGCATVHALAYSIGGAFHVPHGESNYVFFIEVFKHYEKSDPNGKIASLNKVLAELLECDISDVYTELDKLLSNMLSKKSLREYGTSEAQIEEFTDSTLANQQRLLGNSYVPMSREDIRNIFVNLY